MRVLVHAGLCEPSLSDAAVKRLRLLGWKHAYNPNDHATDEDPHKWGGMTLKGELDGSGKKHERDSFTMLYHEGGQRHDPLVLQVFDEMGQEMFTAKERAARNELPWPPDPDKSYPGLVEAIEVPDGMEYVIYQGEGSWESLHEKHRIWYPLRGKDNPLVQGEKSLMQVLAGTWEPP